MPEYVYRALTSSGAARQDRITAASEQQARAALRARGERVVHIREKRASRQSADSQGQALDTRSARRLRSGKPSAEDIAGTIRQLGIMAKAGVPLVESLRGLAEQANSRVMVSALEDMAEQVSQGGALSECFARHPSVFPSLAAEMARVAEAGGNLSESLAKLADHLEAGADTIRKVKGALAYPAVIVLISIVTVLVMVTFILPRFTKLFHQLGAKLPWTTVTLISVSNILTGYWYLVIGVAVGAYLLIRRTLRSPSGKRKFDQFLLRLPLTGDVVAKIVLSRTLACIATLLASGVPMVKTLETAAAAANNEVIKLALVRASRDVAEGSATSQSLKSSGVFPPLVLQMVASGEKTGELPVMLEHVCSLYDRETQGAIKSLTSVIEPVMIVVLGVIVGFIAVSVVVPIYSLVGGVR